MRRFLAIAAVVAAIASGNVAAPAVAAPASLTDKVRQLIRELPGSYTVSARELDGERRTVSIRAAQQLEPASSAKLFIAYAVYRRIDLGLLDYADHVSSGLTVRGCLRTMIEVSDNYCAAELRAKVGQPYLNALLRKGGYDDTHFWYAHGRTKKTSSRDMTTLLARLERGQLLSERSTVRFEKLLASQVWREAIPAGLPVGVYQASKPGRLGTPSGVVETDAAIVRGSRSRYVLSVMGYHGATTAAIARISRLIYRELEEPGGEIFVYKRNQLEATRTVTLRSSPGGSAVKHFGKGTPIELISSRHRWYYVRINGHVGWTLNTRVQVRS